VRRHTGIEVRHASTCRSHDGDGRCSCDPSYRAEVFDRRTSKRIRRTFPTLAAAKAWRADAQSEVRKGVMRGPSGTTLREAAEAWLSGARDGSIRNRSGDKYKPSAIAAYDAALRNRVLPDLGGHRLEDIDRATIQGWIDRLLASDLDPSTIRNMLMPLRVVFRRAIARGVVAVNPTTGLELPAGRGVRDRIASPGEASDLIAALPPGDRAIWATAFYAGLRAGELLALRWEDVDLAAGVIRVERSWDPRAYETVAPKSKSGRRRVPIPAVLRDHLDEHLVASDGEGLVFPRSGRRHHDTGVLGPRARRAWEKAGLDPITLHECRHTFASLMIAAGVNAKALSTYMGHAGVAITFDRYGHLMPGNEAEAGALLDAYLERSDTRGRLASIQGDD
jgi:integrase